MRARSRPFSPRHHLIRSVVLATTALACTAALTVSPALAGDADTAQARPHALPTLKGTVGPGETISINKSSVPAGRYKLVVTDKGTAHNFHITGDGVDKRTSVPGKGKTVWKVDLTEGRYRIVCDPHDDDMRTRIDVT